jgi:hypothetical protein
MPTRGKSRKQTLQRHEPPPKGGGFVLLTRECVSFAISRSLLDYQACFRAETLSLRQRSTFARVMFVNEQAAERVPIHGQKCFVKAIAQIARSRLIRKRTRFAQSSCFVRKARIGFQCGTDFERTNFRLTGKVVGPGSLRIHFAIAGARLVACNT